MSLFITVSKPVKERRTQEGLMIHLLWRLKVELCNLKQDPDKGVSKVKNMVMRLKINSCMQDQINRQDQ